MPPRTAVRPIIPASATRRPRPERNSTSRPMPPMAYIATHLEASARPRATPTPSRTSRAVQARAAPEVQGREQQDGQDDERGHVDVVHGDARVGEEHALSNDQHSRDECDASPGEQHPRQQVEQHRPEDADQHAGQAPAEGVAADADGRQAALGGDGQELGAVCLGPLRLGVGQQHGRVARQRHVDEDRFALGLDDVDGGPAGRVRRRGRGRARQRRSRPGAPRLRASRPTQRESGRRR